MLRPIIEGLRASIRSITEADPAARIWLNDGADTFHPATPDLAEEAARRTVERYAPLDILLGLARPGQETYEWLVEAGYPATAMAGEPVQIDVIGLDYYPNTEQELYGTSPAISPAIRESAFHRGIQLRRNRDRAAAMARLERRGDQVGPS